MIHKVIKQWYAQMCGKEETFGVMMVFDLRNVGLNTIKNF
jgi:hypothetical protein